MPLRPYWELSEKTSNSKNNIFPVVSDEGELTGILSFFDYHNAVFDENLKNLVLVKELATQDVVTVSNDDNFNNALEKITLKDLSILPVVSPDNPSQLLGVLTRKDILDAYNTVVTKKSLIKNRQ